MGEKVVERAMWEERERKGSEGEGMGNWREEKQRGRREGRRKGGGGMVGEITVGCGVSRPPTLLSLPRQ